MTQPGSASENWRSMALAIWQDLECPASSIARLSVAGHESLPSCYPVTDLAIATVGAACLAISELLGAIGKAPQVTVDRRLSSLWFGRSITPVGWEIPASWDPLAGDYRTRDGWIRLHTNAPCHRAAAVAVLQCDATPQAVAEAVSSWSADKLEAAIVDARGCAAAMRTHEAWLHHPQGRAVSAEPLIAVTAIANTKPDGWRPTADRPLAGIRVLDLTRVLAGPVATRFLAGYGADVLRVDPPEWDEPGVVPDVTLGKRCIRLHLREAADRAVFEQLLSEADVLVHGYRAGALEGLGYSSDALQSLRSGLIEVSLNAYGHTGPWHGRRGFDSLVQMSCGIADTGMRWKQSDRPFPLPVQALDHAAGYMIAVAVIRGIQARLYEGSVVRARLSLARTAKLLMDYTNETTTQPLQRQSAADLGDAIETTPWGPARRLKPPVFLKGAPMYWDRPAAALGSGLAEWLK